MIGENMNSNNALRSGISGNVLSSSRYTLITTFATLRCGLRSHSVCPKTGYTDGEPNSAECENNFCQHASLQSRTHGGAVSIGYDNVYRQLRSETSTPHIQELFGKIAFHFIPLK